MSKVESIKRTQVNIIHMTASAAKRFKQIMAEHNAQAIRLTIDKKGCSGLKYRVEPALAINTDDLTFERDAAVVVIAKEDMQYYAGTELDYINQGLNKRLVFNNPRAKNSCGCGESFNVDEEGNGGLR